MGTDLGLALSLAADANSGLQGNNSFGDNIAGGLKLPVWLPLALIGGGFALAVVWLVTRK
ncbi:MAG TPA: hypothetical protein VK846_00670 [Candidatus Limnocylindria bacterium]|nr:hypothetical protein [Candidatus Limnocylindria bacterium]